MAPSLGSLANMDFFQGALPEAVFWGRIALGVGVGGFLVSLLLVLAHLRDRVSLRRGQDKPEEYRPPKLGPLDRCLGEFFADPLHSAPLSPDAASDYVTARLDAEHDVSHSIVRYLSYAPLLLGLMGTTFALRTLLVASGDTLQEIQPQLSGVFAGTLAGIGGSLLAAVGALVLDRVALSSANRAQDFIHRFILPILPERRIAIRIEDAVLALISERAQAVAESFRQALQPVATELEAVAVRSGKAAETATDAFSEAARAVREAGNLEAASRNFKAGAHMIDSSAEQLSDATKQTAEIVLRAGEVRGSLSGLLERIQEASQNLSSASERVGSQLSTQLTELNSQVSRIETSASGLRSAFEGLSAELTRRANADSAQIEATKRFVEATGREVAGLTQMARDTSDSVNTLRAAVDAIDGKAVEAIRTEIKPRIDESTERTEAAVGKLDGLLHGRLGAISETLAEIKQRSDGADRANRDVAAGLRDTASEVRRASEETRKLADEVKQLQPNPESPGTKGLFRWPWK